MPYPGFQRIVPPQETDFESSHKYDIVATAKAGDHLQCRPFHYNSHFLYITLLSVCGHRVTSLQCMHLP